MSRRDWKEKLLPVDPKTLEDFRREMREKVIPKIEEALKNHQTRRKLWASGT